MVNGRNPAIVFLPGESYIKEFTGGVKDAKVVHFEVNAKISFELESK